MHRDGNMCSPDWLRANVQLPDLCKKFSVGSVLVVVLSCWSLIGRGRDRVAHVEEAGGYWNLDDQEIAHEGSETE